MRSRHATIPAVLGMVAAAPFCCGAREFDVPSAEFTVTYSVAGTDFMAVGSKSQVKARKADGSSAHIVRHHFTEQDQHVFDVQAEEERVIAADLKLQAKIQRNERELLGGDFDPATKCAKRFDRATKAGKQVPAGEETLFGFKTYVFRVDDADSRLTMWRAPTLACYPLKWVVESKGGRPSSSTVEATKVELGPPDEALFTCPKGCREVAGKDFPDAVARGRTGAGLRY